MKKAFKRIARPHVKWGNAHRCTKQMKQKHQTRISLDSGGVATTTKSNTKEKNMSEKKKTEALMSLEEFETKVKEILKKPFKIMYDSEKKDNKALSIYLSNEFLGSGLIVDEMQPNWQKAFKEALDALKKYKQSEA